MFNQAVSRGIRSRNQGMIRAAGDQGREAALSCLQPGITARGLSWEFPPMSTATVPCSTALPLAPFWMKRTPSEALATRWPPAA